MICNLWLFEFVSLLYYPFTECPLSQLLFLIGFGWCFIMFQFILLKRAMMIYCSQLKCRTFLDLFWHLKQLFIRLVRSHLDGRVFEKTSLGCRKSADINVDIFNNVFKKPIGWRLLIFSGSRRRDIYMQMAEQ